jgi:hypothetical protein
LAQGQKEDSTSASTKLVEKNISVPLDFLKSVPGFTGPVARLDSRVQATLTKAKGSTSLPLSPTHDIFLGKPPNNWANFYLDSERCDAVTIIFNDGRLSGGGLMSHKI